MHKGHFDLAKASLEASYSRLTCVYVCVMLTAEAKYDKPSPNFVTFYVEGDIAKDSATERHCFWSLKNRTQAAAWTKPGNGLQDVMLKSIIY